jgi:hypothetical protein
MNSLALAPQGNARNVSPERFVENFGGLDITLRQNWNHLPQDPSRQWTEAAWDHCFQIKVRGPFS